MLLILNSAESTVASVHRNNNTGNKRRNIAQQVQHGADQVFGFAVFSHGSIGNNLVTAGGGFSRFFVGEQETVLVGQEKAGSNGWSNSISRSAKKPTI
jgi:hypothetical protein